MPHRLRQELGQIDGVRDVDSARGIDVEYAGDLVLLVAVDFDVYAQYGHSLLLPVSATRPCTRSYAARRFSIGKF